jgi:FAD/FMN-containing dehydrogenase
MEGELDYSPDALAPYAHDESIFTVMPMAVAHPKHVEDVQAVLAFCQEHQVPITARGGGSGTAGQSIGRGIVMDMRTHMNALLDIQTNKAFVQPGLFLGELNDRACKLGKKFGPDPGSQAYAAMGGVVANNAAGAHALAYGMTRDHVLGLSCVLADGQTFHTKDMPKHFSKLVETIKQEQALIEASAVVTSKNSSGYHLESLLTDPPRFEGLLTGSEGTLCLMTEMEVALVDVPKFVQFQIFSFGSRIEAAQAVPPLLDTKPACIELIDQVILQAMWKANPAVCKAMNLPSEGVTLWCEWHRPTKVEIHEVYQTQNADQIQAAWAFRSQASKLLHAQATVRKPMRCIEDACVPVSNLPTYIDEVQRLLKDHDCEGAMFGHIGNGHLHINPGIDSEKPNLQQRVQALMDDFYSLVWKNQGTISGEHGDGYLRAPYAKQQWAQRWPLFQALKDAFDPQGLLNPGKKMPTEVQYSLKDG